MKKKPYKPKEKPISLHPLKTEEAVKLLFKTKKPTESEKPLMSKASKPKRKRPE